MSFLPTRRHGFLSLLLVLFAIAISLLAYQRRAWILNRLESERADSAALAELATAPLTRAVVSAPDWPQWRGPGRDGHAAGSIRTDWKTRPPRVLWSTPGGGGYSSPIVVAGKVYVTDFESSNKVERLRCLDAMSGKVEWEHANPLDYSRLRMGYAGGPRATPTYHKGRLYTVGATGQFQCVQWKDDTRTTEVLWSHDLAEEFRASTPGWGFASSPLIEGDLVIVQAGGREGSVVAFDSNSGQVRWTVGKNPNGYSSPIAATLGGKRQIVAVTGDAILGIGIDGQLLWSHPWLTEHNANIATPIVVGDYVFVSSNYNKGCVLLQIEENSAREVYFRKSRVMASHLTTCVEREGFLFGFDGHNQSAVFRCVNMRTGEVNEGWEALDDRARPIRHSSLLLIGSQLLGLTETGTLFLADANPSAFQYHGDLEGILSGRECWSLPAYLDGKIYLRDAEKIVCVDLR